MRKKELPGAIRFFCSGERFWDSEPIYARFREFSREEVNDAIEALVELGALRATIKRRKLVDGTIRTISDIRG